MTGKQTELFVSIALFLLLTGSARAATIRGVTVNKNMSDPDSRSEVFTIDTETRTVTNLHTTTLDEYNLGRNYSDIAITASGGIYAIGSDYKDGGSFFEDLFRLDPTTGLATDAWHNVNLRGKPINGLTALDETTLLAVEGGRAGIVLPHLIQINLDPVTGGTLPSYDLGGYVKWNTAGLDSVSASVSNVPEPSTVLLLGLGSLAFFGNRPF